MALLREVPLEGDRDEDLINEYCAAFDALANAEPGTTPKPDWFLCGCLAQLTAARCPVELGPVYRLLALAFVAPQDDLNRTLKQMSPEGSTALFASI